MKIKLKKKKNESSSKWLSRHLNDEFYKKSKKDGFRSRASYKLIQINQKFEIFKDCKNILDLGCSPGGWLQVAKRNSLRNCKILGIDKLDLKKIDGVDFIQGDIFNEKIINTINEFFNQSKIDLILNDMSPNSSGNKNIDHLRIVSLVERVIYIANNILKKEGIIISKIFQGGAQGDLLDYMKINFYSIKYFKPQASRKESSETYLIGKKK